jgi:hypothetical protein
MDGLRWVMRSAFVWLLIALLCGIADGSTVAVFSDRSSFDVAAGSTVIENFTIPGGSAALLLGPLNSSSSYPAEFGFGPVTPGDIIPGVTFSSPSDTNPIIGPQSATFFIDFGGTAGFDGSFLATYDRGGPAQPLTATFAPSAYAVGFDTDHVYSGDRFTAALQFTSGPDITETLSNSVPDGTTTFYGFVSTDGTPITQITLVGDSAIGSGFGLDNFAFSSSSPITDPSLIPLPAGFWLGIVTAPLAAFAIGWFSRRMRARR